MVALLTVTEEDEVRILYLGPLLEDYAMAVAEQWFYRDDALRLGNRKQFCGVCVKPKEFTKDQFRKQAKISILVCKTI